MKHKYIWDEMLSCWKCYGCGMLIENENEKKAHDEGRL